MNALALFKPHGQPTLRAADRAFKRKAERQTGAIERAYAQLNHALDADDVEGLVVACRRFLAVGLVLGDAAREAERGRANV